MAKEQEESERLWSWAFHEDNLFDSRMQVFLLAHTLLVTAVGFSLDDSDPPRFFHMVVASIGVLLGIVWMAFQYRATKIVRALTSRLTQTDKLFREVFQVLDRGIWRLWSQTRVLAIIPWVATIAWSVFALYLGFQRRVTVSYRGVLAMTPDQLQLYTFWLRLAGLLVSIVGIILVLRQLRQVGATILGSAFSSSFAELREIHKIFIERPELRPYFYDNAWPPDSEIQKARAVAEMFLDAFIHMHLLRPRFPEELKPHIDLLIEDMVNSSDFLADYLKENAQFITPELRSFVLGLIEVRRREAKSQAPNPGPQAVE